MKKIYFTILSFTCMLAVNAQVSLTKAFNEPVIGDMSFATEFDSLGTLPNTIGADQLWDFSSLVSNLTPNNVTYTTVASTANGANYSTATMADDDGAGTNLYYKSATTQLEIVGIVSPIFSAKFSNSAVAAIWPITYGYNNSDVFSGTASSSTMTGTSYGNINVQASGSGTLMLPDGLTLNNILQVKTTQTVNVSLLLGFVTATVVTTMYDYYDDIKKFPVLSVNYTDIQGAFTNYSAIIKINGEYVTGVKEKITDANFMVFPNPATENVNISLTNKNQAKVKLEIFNSVGMLVKTVDLGTNVAISNSISISDLSNGIYIVKTSVGEKVSTRKLVIE